MKKRRKRGGRRRRRRTEGKRSGGEGNTAVLKSPARFNTSPDFLQPSSPGLPAKNVATCATGSSCTSSVSFLPSRIFSVSPPKLRSPSKRERKKEKEKTNLFLYFLLNLYMPALGKASSFWLSFSLQSQPDARRLRFSCTTVRKYTILL